MGSIGIPELLILALPLIIVFFVVILVVWVIKRSSKKSPVAQPAPYHSNVAVEISKLDDLMKKGLLTQEEFQRRKNELMKRL